MGDRLVRADKPAAELAARCPHFQIGDDGLATANAASHKHRHVLHVGQNLLRQHARRHRADVTAGLHAFDHQGVGAMLN